jgi:hypothetical protein
MKVLVSLLFAAALLTGANGASAVNNNGAIEAPKGKICFKIENDTGKSQTLHTGSGTTVINGSTTNEICIEDGGKLYAAVSGSKGKVLLNVNSSVSGKTFKLSKLL